MNTNDVTVVTTSIPNRHPFLVECMESVRNQTMQPYEHKIGIDYERVGSAKNLNRLVQTVETTWIAPLADDDLFKPFHIQRLMETAIAEDADMVYPFCEVIGRGAWNPNSTFDPKRLAYDNYIPATVLIKKSVIDELGGYPDAVCEDHAMWVKMLNAGKKIVCLPEVTWTYRFHGRNISDGKILPWDV